MRVQRTPPRMALDTPLRTGLALHWRMAIARPQRWYFTLTDDTAGAYSVELPSQRSIIAGLILAAMFAIYVVLGVLYESFAHPFTVLTTLPSAGVGALLALMA
mgnify:CR=1 FL=1